MNDFNYAGDITAEKAWDLLKENNDCQLIDCRSSAEWNFVGVPDLGSLNKKVFFIEWQSFPLMEQNKDFLREISDSGLTKETQMIFICRSGARSRSAAEFLTSQGYKNCFNFSSGFEGVHDINGQRGKTNGWKFSKLPWKQG